MRKTPEERTREIIVAMRKGHQMNQRDKLTFGQWLGVVVLFLGLLSAVMFGMAGAVYLLWNWPASMFGWPEIPTYWHALAITVPALILLNLIRGSSK